MLCNRHATAPKTGTLNDDSGGNSVVLVAAELPSSRLCQRLVIPPHGIHRDLRLEGRRRNGLLRRFCIC